MSEHSEQQSSQEQSNERISRRAHKRAPLEIEVSLESEHNFYAGIAGNVSEGGLFIATHMPPPTGAAVEVHLQLQGNKFDIEGEVCWTRDAEHSSEWLPAGCGIRWLRVSDAALQAISEFVDGRETILFEE